MKRFALVMVIGIVLMAGISVGPSSEANDGKGSRLTAGPYTGASQLMIINNGKVSYDDAPLGICHMEIFRDDTLRIEFPDKKLERDNWHQATLLLSSSKPRTTWTAQLGDDTYKVTAIPYSSKLYLFRLEITNDGKLVAGAQQFYAIEPKT